MIPQIRERFALGTEWSLTIVRFARPPFSRVHSAGNGRFTLWLDSSLVYRTAIMSELVIVTGLPALTTRAVWA